ncbi:MAG TPA: hypothetical protein VFI06_11175, partial [Chitinophagaceae bacterium]|nr:hypothetical protein [Chitinophagaceae bacterium]
MKIFLLFAGLLLTTVVKAQGRFWVGSTSTDWNIAANWSLSSGGSGGASVPDMNSQVFIDMVTPNACILGTTTTIQQLTVSSGSLSLTATGNLTVTNTFTLSGGVFSLDSGSLTVNGFFSITNGTFNANSGTISVTSNTFSVSGGTLNAGSANFFVSNNMIIGSPSSIQPGTSTVTFNGAGQQDVLALSSGVSGKIVFYNLIINKSNNSQINFNTSASTDTFQIDNLLTLTAGRFTGSGFIRIEKDVVTEANFGGSGIPIACTGPNPGNVTLGSPLAVTGVTNFVGIIKNSPSVTVSVFRAASAPDDTIRVGNFDAKFIVRTGILQFPNNNPVLARFQIVQIEPGGTFIAPTNYLFNAGQHINTGGIFNANGGTYVFYYPAIPNSTQITNHIETFNNLIIDNQTQFGPGTNDTLVVNGTFTYRNGTNAGQPGSAFSLKGDVVFEAGAGASLGVTSLIFSGSGNQNVSFAPGKEDVWNGSVTIDKPGGTMTLNSPWILDNFNKTFTFTRGIINIPDTANNYLFFTNQFLPVGASAASYVDGPVRVKRWTSDPFEFPIGNAGFYGPIRISDFWGTGEDVVFSGQYYHQPSVFATNPKEATLANVSQREWWHVKRLVGTAPPPPYLWLSYDNVRSGGVTDPSKLRVSRWNSITSIWEDHGNGAMSGNFIRSTQAIQDFSPFTLASTDQTANPLPVQLISFNVVQQDRDGLLTWRTASEQNSNRFEIEQSNDGISFTKIGQVAGAGNSSTDIDYSFTD